MAVYYNKPA